MAKPSKKSTSPKLPRGISTSAFEAAVNKGELPPVVVAHGGEPLLLDRVLNSARTGLLDPETADFNLDVLYGEDGNAQALASALGSMPMMDERRVILIKRAGSLPQAAKDYLVEYVKNPVATTLLVLLFEEEKPAAWVSKVAAKAMLVDCNAPRGAALREWVVATVKERGAEIDEDALDLITDTPGMRLIDLDQELEKATLLTVQNGRITLETLQLVWGIEPEVNIWAFMDRVAAGSRLPALRDLNKLRETFDKQIGLVFSQTVRRWRMALKEKRYDAARVPFAQRQWSGNTKRQWQMASSELKSLPENVADVALQRMLELDRKRKTTSFDDEMAFEMLVHKTALDRKRAGK